MYKAGQGDEELQGDTLDPGLVMTGTKCGVDSVRLNIYKYIIFSVYYCVWLSSGTLMFLSEIRHTRRDFTDFTGTSQFSPSHCL